MNNKVSIIVPCYNQAEYLPETLDCVLAQTYTNWECIIVDDGSVDASAQVAKDYQKKDARFTYLYQENQGPSVARNNGIRHTNGEYILPLDADDLIDKTYIEKAIKAFAANPELKVVYCKARRFGDWNDNWDIPNYSYEKILWNNMIFVSALYKREDYNKMPGYNPNMRAGWEDWDFWLSFLKPGDQVHRIDEILFSYRAKDISRNANVPQIEQDLLHVIYRNHAEKYAPYLQDIIYVHRQNDSLEAQCRKLKKNQQDILNTFSYRLGDMLLKPLKKLKSLLPNKDNCTGDA